MNIGLLVKMTKRRIKGNRIFNYGNFKPKWHLIGSTKKNLNYTRTLTKSLEHPRLYKIKWNTLNME